MIQSTKIYSNDLFNLCTVHEVQNADSAIMFVRWCDDQLHDIYATNDFTIVRKMTVMFAANTDSI